MLPVITLDDRTQGAEDKEDSILNPDLVCPICVVLFAI
jgi:hypothetical protein